MRTSSRFTIALHIFTCTEVFRGKAKITSDFLASSINTNPVIIRKILLQLSAAGLIKVQRGTGGVEVTRDLDRITFLDVYRAVEKEEGESLFHFHENPSPLCPVGRNIHAVLDDKLASIESAMEEKMKSYTLAMLVADMDRQIKNEEK